MLECSRTLARAGVVASFLIGSGAAAQARPVATQSDSASAPAMVTPANAARLKAGKWTYVTRLMGDGPPSRLGFRTLELRDSTWGGAPAWMLIDTRQLATVTLADTVFLAKKDLAPLHRAAHAPGSDAIMEFGRDSIRATFSGQDGAAHVALAAAPAVVLANLYLVEPLLAVVPLDTAWRGSAQLAALARDGSGVIPVRLHTTGAEKVLTPDGLFDAWMLTMDIGKGSERLWVRKSDGVLLKERVPVLGQSNAEIELLLAEHGVGEAK